MKAVNTQPTEIETRVERELTEIPRNKQGQLLLTLAENGNLAEETRLVLLLDAAAGTWFIAEPAVFHALKEEFYGAIHGTRGGLTFDAYNKYARHCKQVAEAAARHRAFIEAKQRKA